MTLNKGLRLLWLLIMISSQAIAQKQINPKKYRLLTYGLPDQNLEELSSNYA